MKDQERSLFLAQYSSAKQEADEAARARDEAQGRLDRANARVQAWAVIVEQSGLGGRQNTVPYLASTPANGSTNAPIGTSNAFMGTGEGNNKTHFVLATIQGAGAVGASPAEIKAAATRAGLQIYAGYPYTVIHRLKEQGKVLQAAEGRYVASGLKPVLP